MTANLRSITLSSKGQITLSKKARDHLHVKKGATLMELIVGNCVILLPEDQVLSEAMKGARSTLAKVGVTVKDLKEEIECLKEKRFAKEFPDLA